MPDELVFGLVVAARLGLPLGLGRFPLPAIIACLVVDAVDQTIFEQYTSMSLDDYQTYDKALDVYYLAVAYLATIRNWGGGPDFEVGRVLWYYRLVGVLVFEYTSSRWMLFVFPNTFEYYFIVLEAFNVRRDSNRLSTRQVVTIAAIIWIVIKLPQEWWIHIAQRDVTDELKELFGVDPDSPWLDAVGNRPGVAVAIGAVIVVGVAIARIAARRLPPPLWSATFDADRHADRIGWQRPRRPLSSPAYFNWTFVEKVVLVGLISAIFTRILPGADARLPLMLVVTAYVIAVNTLLSQWLARRGTTWRNLATELVVMAAANTAIVVVTGAVLGRGGGSTPLGTTLFLVGLLTLIVVLYDRSFALLQLRQRSVDTVSLSPAGRTT